jgi:hypothetical protein
MRVDAALGVGLAAALIAGCGGGSASTSSSPSSTAGTGGSPTTATAPSTATTSSAPTATKPAKARKGAGQKPAPKPAKSAPTTPATPQATVTAALTSARCDLYTPRLLAKSYGGLAGCRAALNSGGSAKSVEIQRTQPEGKFALVVAVPRGGPSSGEKLAVSLVKEGGGWRLEAIHSNVKVGP